MLQISVETKELCKELPYINLLFDMHALYYIDV